MAFGDPPPPDAATLKLVRLRDALLLHLTRLNPSITFTSGQDANMGHAWIHWHQADCFRSIVFSDGTVWLTWRTEPTPTPGERYTEPAWAQQFTLTSGPIGDGDERHFLAELGVRV